MPVRLARPVPVKAAIAVRSPSSGCASTIPYPTSVVGLPVVILVQSKLGMSEEIRDAPMVALPLASTVSFVYVPGVTPEIDNSPTPSSITETTVFVPPSETPKPIRRTPGPSGIVDQSQGNLGLKEIAAGTVLAGLGWVINRRMAASRTKSR